MRIKSTLKKVILGTVIGTSTVASVSVFDSFKKDPLDPLDSNFSHRIHAQTFSQTLSGNNFEKNSTEFDISKYFKKCNYEPIVKPTGLYITLLDSIKRRTHSNFVILVNTAACEMVVYDGENYSVHGVVVGRYRYKNKKYDFRTKELTTTITQVIFNPWWYPPHRWWTKNRKITPPGPNNPLGKVKMVLKNSSYRIHGNNMEIFRPGHYSHGCIRMRNDEAVELGKKVKKAIKNGEKVVVSIVYKPIVLETMNFELDSYLSLKVYADYYHKKINYKKELESQIKSLFGKKFDNADLTPLFNVLRKPGRYLFKITKHDSTITFERVDTQPLYVIKEDSDSVQIFVEDGMSFSSKKKILKEVLKNRYSENIANKIIYRGGLYTISFQKDSIKIKRDLIF